MDTLQECCADEYTLASMLNGTYSFVMVPVLQGAIEAVPKAFSATAMTPAGMTMLDKLVHHMNVRMPT